MSESKHKTLGVIPVRMESQRLPNKPLLDIDGLPLVIRVWKQARLANCFSKLVVATDSEQIAQSCKEHGAEVVFTSDRPRNGSERVYEAIEKLNAIADYDLVFNVQGDMPFIAPAVIENVAHSFMLNFDKFDMATLCLPITKQEEYNSNSSVKVVFDRNYKALYFSRAAIPNYRSGSIIPEILSHKHIGLYAFKPSALQKLVNFEPSALELAESLEQLRALENNLNILIVPVSREMAGPSIEVDTLKDLELANSVAKKLTLQMGYS